MDFFWILIGLFIFLHTIFLQLEEELIKFIEIEVHFGDFLFFGLKLLVDLLVLLLELLDGEFELLDWLLILFLFISEFFS